MTKLFNLGMEFKDADDCLRRAIISVEKVCSECDWEWKEMKDFLGLLCEARCRLQMPEGVKSTIEGERRELERLADLADGQN